MRANKASFWENREYESSIHAYRVSRGLTLKNLSKAAEVSIGYISSLANGTRSPIFAMSGHVKPSVSRIAKVLRADVEDLFPRYFCKIKSDSDVDLLEAQLNEITVSTYSQVSAEEIVSRTQTRDKLGEVLNSLPVRQAMVIRSRFFSMQTYSEIAQFLRVTVPRVQQIEATALRKLRHPSRAKILTELTA